MPDKVKINECSRAELLSLPGVGHTIMERIVNLREAFGNVTLEHLQAMKRLRVTADLIAQIDFAPCDKGRSGSREGSDEDDDEQNRMTLPKTKLFGGNMFSSPPPPMPYGYPSYPPSPSPGYYGQMPMPWYPPPTQQYSGPPFSQSQTPTNPATKPKRGGSGTTPSSKDVKLPSSITYNGTSKWKPFFKKFTTFADEQAWTARQRKNHLCYCLQGKACDYYASITEQEPDMEYFDLVAKMESRFGFQELAETVQGQFQNARQKPEESVVEWAERVLTMASRAFHDLPEKHLRKQSVFKFCQGLVDKDAGQYALNLRVEAIDDALDKVKWYQHTNKMLHPRQPARGVYQIEADSDKEYDIYATGPGTKPRQQYSSPQTQSKVRFIDTKSDLEKQTSKLEDRVNTSETGMENLKLTVEKGFQGLEKALSTLTTRPRSRSPSPMLRAGCFQCGKPGHFKKECPEKATKVTKCELEEEDGCLNF